MVEEKRKRRRGDEEEAAPKRVYRRAFNTEVSLEADLSLRNSR